MSAVLEGELRRRRLSGSKGENASVKIQDAKTSKAKEEVVWGKTPSGEVFRVPTTHDVLTLFHPRYPKSHLDILSLTLLGLQIVAFFVLPRPVAKRFFLAYFAFWRTAYDAGLGWVLTKQSKKRWIVREMQKLGWLDENRKPGIRNWIRKQLAGKMGKDYSFDELPLEYNTWLLFRQLVDIILLNDFVSYCLFAFCCFRVPEGLPVPVHVFRWLGGLILITFNLWVKTEAHHVVKDYGWYWGDCFFQRGALVFDGVFELAPHPMYSVGYAGYYGLSLIVGSYPVLFVSIAAHAAQFGFLVSFENPHIERTYGQKKLLASRIPPVCESSLSRKSTRPSTPVHNRSVSIATDNSTPSVTEGESATETDLETETELDIVELRTPRIGSSTSLPSISTSRSSRSPMTRILSQHDLLNRYFRKDVILLHNFDPLRASDFMLGLVVFYAIVMIFLPPLSAQGQIALHFTHALLWRVYHTFVLGSLLKAQSNSKFLVRHYLKHYYYPDSMLASGEGAVQEAFTNWKSIYNMSMLMTYSSFFGFAWKTYQFPQGWIVGDQLLRHTLGIFLILLHVWAARESYEVLGVFGWFFGDFFIDNFPTTLEYTGIFRFLNNPEILSGSTFFGLALITGSKSVLTLAIFTNLSYWWFLRTVENPHMKKLYGDALRKDAGLTKVIKKVATKNARILESRAGKHVPQLGKVAKEVKGSFDKVFKETEEVVEEFLNKSKPKLSEVLQDTKVLLQQSREKLVITRIASDISSFDTTQYSISVVTNGSHMSGGKYRFHLGEPIIVDWRAPPTHSRKDWIGLYRLGANKSSLVTTTSSLGMWVPVHDDEWEGDIYLGPEDKVHSGTEPETGKVIFKGETLPWHVGTYEVRYHHDGMYNVMSLDGPIEIYVDPPASLDFQSIRWYLMHIVTLCLDADPSLVPLSSKPPGSPPASPEDHRDPDDFRFWSEKQAARIAKSIQAAFGVEYDPEVILAEANVSALTNRILVSKQLLDA
ncbi:phosphatidylethanolamine N-methyltransferase [Fomitiporia mediterranea MF3/22]|uniref:phosphatidylethanolamine N-methyltransferase n=1 Tax=Fomitiporia mediterranea (strain MF3/22) TaxID=694068 RepID=UPI0004409BF2|nr:phosphatidylethanolamine N-methyltransferase [Fomitiporia mediterranea MF3/22]EJD05138.1 phosphatidylethanolamine N-methyltransferase [Fomitiporia mediterranea MF3/22]